MENQYSSPQNFGGPAGGPNPADPTLMIAGQPGQGQAQASPPPKKRRGWCFCCLAVLLLPVLLLLGLLIWVASGPAPTPADCMPPDAQVRFVVREPTVLVDRVSRDPFWRSTLEQNAANSGTGKGLPPAKEIEGALFVLRQMLGSEVAAGLGSDGKWTGACRPGIWARGFERIARGELKKQKPGNNFYYEMVGKTAVFSDDPDAIKAVQGRRDEILAARGEHSPAAETQVEVRFKDFEPAVQGAPEEGLRGAAFILELSSAEKFSGRLGLDRSLANVDGYLHFAAGKHGAPPKLPAAGPASARLVPAKALGYWAWNAPKSDGRWGPFGRLEEWLSLTDAELKLDGPEAQELKMQLGVDIKHLIQEELIGERALAVVHQQLPDGKPLIAAASLIIETRDPAKAWPTLSKLVSMCMGYPLSEDGQPPKDGGLDVYPYLVERPYKGKKYLELVYATYPHGTGYRPAFGMAGRFFVATTSKQELQRMMDLAAGPKGGSLAVDPELMAAAQKDLSSLMLLRPQGKGKEIADLMLAARHAFAKQGEELGQEAAQETATLGRMLTALESLRCQWRPQKDGSLKIEIDGKIKPPAR